MEAAGKVVVGLINAGLGALGGAASGGGSGVVAADDQLDWLNDLFDVEGECPYTHGSAAQQDWPEALAIRQALDAAI